MERPTPFALLERDPAYWRGRVTARMQLAESANLPDEYYEHMRIATELSEHARKVELRLAWAKPYPSFLAR